MHTMERMQQGQGVVLLEKLLWYIILLMDHTNLGEAEESGKHWIVQLGDRSARQRPRNTFESLKYSRVQARGVNGS